jgi:hypothetical protein
MNPLKQHLCARPGHFTAGLPDGSEAEGIPCCHVDVAVADDPAVLRRNPVGPQGVEGAEGHQVVGHRAIVNIASQAGIVGIEERAACGTSEAGMIHLAKMPLRERGHGGPGHL